METHAKIVSALKRGDSAGALAEVDRLLAATTEDADLLGLKGLALSMSGRINEGADFVRRAVKHAADPMQRVKHAGNLARLLANAGRRHELSSLPELHLSGLDQVPDDALDLAAIENLCAPLLAADRQEFVADFLGPVIDRPAATWAIERLWLRATEAAG